MAMQIYWINQFVDGSLATMPAPAGGKDLGTDVGLWDYEGIEVVASLLEPGEVPDLDGEVERTLCEKHGIEFHSFPIVDKDTPVSMDEAEVFIRRLALGVRSGRPVAVHCRAGIGRSSLIAAGVLMCLGIERAHAIEMISVARGLRVPETEVQSEWLKAFERRVTSP
jgi:protein-tyrosine phosphatase